METKQTKKKKKHNKTTKIKQRVWGNDIEREKQ